LLDELVRALARQIAERDYKRLLKNPRRNDGKKDSEWSNSSPSSGLLLLPGACGVLCGRKRPSGWKFIITSIFPVMVAAKACPSQRVTI
jgi:hypothetical protein